MPLTLKRNRDGSYRPFWYGVVQVDGKRTIRNLTIPVEGTAPETLRNKGDAAFEASRKVAKNELKKLKEELSGKGRADHLVERLIVQKTGKQVEYVRLADLPDRWRILPREAQPSEAWLKSCDTMFHNFTAETKVVFLYEVTPEMVAKYLMKLRAQCTRKTVRNVVTLFRSAFKRFLPTGAHNPFTDGVSRKNETDEGDTIHRLPFTPAELVTLLDAARPDPFLYPLVVTAACTGMRRGDVCRLQWSSVDLDANVISVRTSKTGATVEIPIFKPLRDVLLAAKAERINNAVYVWPSAARMADESPDSLTWRFKKLLAAILPDPDAMKADATAEFALPPVSLAPVLDKVCDAVSRNLEGPMRHRVLNSLRRYAEGASIRDIEAATGQPRSGVSGDLHRAEELSKIYFMPSATRIGAKNKISRLTRQVRGRGIRAASVLDWHALRVTWVTLALSAGVPMELVKLVTGHKTVEVVLRHYFKPGREQLRLALQDKLPMVLTGVEEPKAEQPRKKGSVKSLAAKVASGKATPEEMKSLSELLSKV